MKAAPLEPRTAYDLWADTYPAVAHNPLMRVEQSVVEAMLRHLRGFRALDVGTGSGRYLPLLRATGAAVVAGVDFSIAMLTRGERAGKVCGDACHLPFRRSSFDVVNASLMVGDIEDLEAWTREIARVLTAGGHLVYSDFHPSWSHHGWSRTFRTAAGALHDVAFHAHSIDDHLSALEHAGLRVRTIREPRFNDDAEPGVKAFRRRWGNPQVVVVFHAVKEL
ncbi:MAG TPA: class I SAM-dependent methyltransferase [Vicinamibacterales bacterium]|nr:class I SAM-dependent methyltransferase [Vicinamibacterales bacterium]